MWIQLRRPGATGRIEFSATARPLGKICVWHVPNRPHARYWGRPRDHMSRSRHSGVYPRSCPGNAWDLPVPSPWGTRILLLRPAGYIATDRFGDFSPVLRTLYRLASRVNPVRESQSTTSDHEHRRFSKCPLEITRVLAKSMAGVRRQKQTPDDLAEFFQR